MIDQISTVKKIPPLVFYVDWSDPTKWIKDNDSIWSDGSTASTTSPSGNMPIDTRVTTLAIASIITPRGDTLDKYEIIDLQGQVYRTIASGAIADAWGDAGHHNTSTPAGGGVFVSIYEGLLLVQTGRNGLTMRWSSVSGTPFGEAANLWVTSAPGRIRIVCAER